MCRGARAEVQRIERVGAALLHVPLNAQHAGLTQARVADRREILAAAVARIERALATAKLSPS
jgi:hypothetical protein